MPRQATATIAPVETLVIPTPLLRSLLPFWRRLSSRIRRPRRTHRATPRSSRSAQASAPAVLWGMPTVNSIVRGGRRSSRNWADGTVRYLPDARPLTPSCRTVPALTMRTGSSARSACIRGITTGGAFSHTQARRARGSSPPNTIGYLLQSEPIRVYSDGGESTSGYDYHPIVAGIGHDEVTTFMALGVLAPVVACPQQEVLSDAS
jgi:hypothetical protein